MFLSLTGVTYCAMDQAEVYFLILHYLSSGPCKEAAEVLEKQALEAELLPKRYDVLGEPPRTFTDSRTAYLA